MVDRSTPLMTLVAELALARGELSLDIAIEVSGGETVALVGPNGAGKTTLLRTLAGLLAVDSGRVVLDGATLDEPNTSTFVTAEQRPVGMVFQEHRLFPHLDALANIAFGLRARGMPRARADEIAAGWLDRMGLTDVARLHPAKLSGGQAQRVALARALAVEPHLLLLDEPLAALDAATRADVRHDLRAHLAGFSGVRLIVTHDPVDAAVLADRIVVLDRGRVVQDGTPADITARPRTRWVADLVGTNLYAGTATGAGVALDGGGSLTVAGDGPHGQVFAAVHPRAVALHAIEPAGAARNVWRGRVSSVERVGDRVRVRVQGTPTITAELTAAGAAALVLGEGAETWVAVKATEIDVYRA